MRSWELLGELGWLTEIAGFLGQNPGYASVSPQLRTQWFEALNLDEKNVSLKMGCSGSSGMDDNEIVVVRPPGSLYNDDDVDEKEVGKGENSADDLARYKTNPHSEGKIPTLMAFGRQKTDLQAN